MYAVCPREHKLSFYKHSENTDYNKVPNAIMKHINKIGGYLLIMIYLIHINKDTGVLGNEVPIENSFFHRTRKGKCIISTYADYLNIQGTKL